MDGNFIEGTLTAYQVDLLTAAPGDHYLMLSVCTGTKCYTTDNFHQIISTPESYTGYKARWYNSEGGPFVDVYSVRAAGCDVNALCEEGTCVDRCFPTPITTYIDSTLPEPGILIGLLFGLGLLLTMRKWRLRNGSQA